MIQCLNLQVTLWIISVCGIKKRLIFNRININSTQDWKEIEKPLIFQHKFEEFQL